MNPVITTITIISTKGKTGAKKETWLTQSARPEPGSGQSAEAKGLTLGGFHIQENQKMPFGIFMSSLAQTMLPRAW